MTEEGSYQNIIVEFNVYGKAVDAKNVDGTELIYGEEEKLTIFGAVLRSYDETLEHRRRRRRGRRSIWEWF